MTTQVYALRIGIMFVAATAAFCHLGTHLYDLQVVRHQELFEKARKTYTSSRRHLGHRGRIYDVHGNLLVGNLNCQDIRAEPRRIPPEDLDRVIITLAMNLHIDAALLRRRFTSKAVEVVVANDVSSETAEALKSLDLPGLRFVDAQKRHYPKGQLLANLLGFTSFEGKGVAGLESVWDRQLEPREVEVTFERNRKGQPLHRDPTERDGSIADGRSLYLTIDEPIQDKVERELADLAAEHKPKRAYAIMANPRTGAIMAMAQWPSYNPNKREEMDPEHWRNHMIEDVYDPGSTMKSIAIAGALDYDVVRLHTVFNCEKGRWYYGGRSLRDAGHKYEDLTVAAIMQKSSNIGTAKIAVAMGRPRLYQTLRRFGFGDRTGIRLHHESRGLLRPPSRWDGLSITRFPIGQGVSVTPMQMVQAYCALANDGRMMQLRLADRLYDPRTGQVAVIEPELKQVSVRPKAAYDIVTAMIRVTGEGGTAKRARVEGYEVAGKTGTSQKLIDGSYVGHGKYMASFIGFVPARDPAFVLLVVADEPSGRSYYGGTVCGPTFSRISEETLRYLNVTPYNSRSSDPELTGGS